MRVRNKFDADESIIALKKRLRFLQRIEFVRLILNVTIRCDEKASRACRWVLDDFFRLGFIKRTMQLIKGRGVKYCPAPDFFSAAFFSNSPS
jgi:hypothetical protein